MKTIICSKIQKLCCCCFNTEHNESLQLKDQELSWFSYGSVGDLIGKFSLSPYLNELNFIQSNYSSIKMIEAINTALKSAQKNNIDFDMQNESGDTVLIYAIKKANEIREDISPNFSVFYFHLADALISRGASPFIKNYRGETALSLATYNNNKELVEKISDNLVEKNSSNYKKKSYSSIITDDYKSAFNTGSNSNLSSIKECFQLSLALSFQNKLYEISLILLDKFFNCKNELNFFDEPEIVKLICNNFIQIAKVGNLDYIKKFMRFIDINFINDKGESALISPYMLGKKEVTYFLINDRKINFNIGDMENNTILILASNVGDKEIIRKILQISKNRYAIKLDINKQNDKGETALMIAIKNSHYDIVDLLLCEKNININIQTNDGNTALIFALIYLEYNDETKLYSNIRILSKLLKMDADITLKNNTAIALLNNIKIANPESYKKLFPLFSAHIHKNHIFKRDSV